MYSVPAHEKAGHRASFRSPPLIKVIAVTKPRHETRPVVMRWSQTVTFGYFYISVFSGGRLQHISYLHSKLALRVHHVRKYGRRPICDAENRRGK